MSTAAQPTEPAADRPPEPARSRAPALPAKTLPGEGGLRRLPGVVLFAAGRHTDMAGRTREFGRDYLQGVVDRFAEFKAGADFHHEPPAVLGHEVVQAKLAEILSGDDTYKKTFAGHRPTPGGGPGRTDQLAAGWPDNLRLEGDSLVGDLERIPPSVADLIDSGQLRYPSVEFQEGRRRADGMPVPPYLHRLALLGGTPPGCKSVPPLGQAHFADAPDGVVFFADAVPADAADTPPEADGPPDKPMLALLQKCYPQLSTAFLQSLTRKQMDQLATDHVAANPDQQQPTPPNDYGVTAMADTITDAAKPKPKPPAEPPPNPATPKPAPPPKPQPAPSAELAAFADGLRAEFAEREAALDAKAEAIRRAADGALAAQKARDDAEWSRAVDAFCDAELKSGRISPAELDATDPLNLRVRLANIPAADVIAFADADGKPQTKSRREAELDAIRKRPVRMFGDRVPAAGVADERAAQKAAIREFHKAQQPAARN